MALIASTDAGNTAAKLRTQRFASVTFILLGMLSLLWVTCAQALDAPTWQAGNPTQSANGAYTIRWNKPFDAEYVRINEIGPGGVSNYWFSFRDFEAFVKNEPGTYTYSLQSCTGVVESPTVCTPSSSATHTVTIDAGVRGHHEQMPSADEAMVQALNGNLSCTNARTSQPGGPNALIPGAWWTDCQPGHGWAFYWVNALRFEEGSDLHRNIYELIGVWATYRYMNGSYQPVWFYLPMRSISSLVYDGPILYQTLANNGSCAEGEYIGGSPEKCQFTAGHVRVIFAGGGNNSEADVEWHLNMPGMPVVNSMTQHITPLASSVAGSMAADNHVDFQSGWWWSRNGNSLDESFAYMVQVYKDIEFDHVIFFDDQGEPIWLNAQKNVDPANSNSVNFSGSQLRYPHTGYAPGMLDQDYQQVDLTTSTLSRSFDPITVGHSRSGQFSASIDVNHGGRTASLNKNTAMIKVVNFFDVDFVIDGQPNGQSVCEVVAAGSCNVNLNWFRDDHFPFSTLWRRNLDTNETTFLTTLTQPANDSYGQTLAQGRYQFEIYRQASTTSPLLAKSRVLDVTETQLPIDSPPAPFADPLLQAPNSSARVGATEGRFEVNASGAATYSIPILAAQGSGGLQPAVSLNYNSQSGNGLAGLGWSLSAYSLISRCSQTYEQDADPANPGFIPTGVQLNDSDRFCLDGQRLLLVEGAEYGANGAVYRKELDDFVRVTSSGNSGNGPACFTVEMPNGGIAHYGNCGAAPNSSALILSDLTSGIPYAWAQARLEDLAGNYMNYFYLAPSAGIEILLDRIEFTGNVHTGHTPYAALEFDYEFKPASERAESFVATKKLISQRRLKTIHSTLGAQYLRSYHLEYSASNDGVGRSILGAIQECHQPPASGGICFDKTRFTWQRGNNASGVTAATSSFTLADYDLSTTSTNRHQVQTGDFNGDGKDDLFYVGLSGQLHVALGQGDGGFQALPAVAAMDLDHYLLSDVNSDAYLDVVYISTTDNHWYAHLWNGDNLGGQQRIDLGITNTIPVYGSSVVNVMDFDGDGAADFVARMGDFLAIFPNAWHSANGNISQLLGEPHTIGFDLSDIFISVGGGWQPLGNSEPEIRLDSGVRAVDMNADGVVELLVTVEQEFCQTVDPSNEFFCPPPNFSETTEKDLSAYSPTLQPYLDYSVPDTQEQTVTGAIADARVWAIARLDRSQGELIYTVNEIGGATGCAPCDGFIFSGAPITADINGDGLSDAIALGRYAVGVPNEPLWGYALNTGQGVFLSNPALTVDYDSDFKHSNIADYNADSYPDLWVALGDSSTDKWQVHLWEWTSAGGRFSTNAITTQTTAGEVFSGSGENSLESDRTLMMDLDGDGDTDPVMLRKSGSQWGAYPAFSNNTLGNNEPAFVITQIDNGLGDADGDSLDDADGAKIVIDYGRLTDPTLYERDNNSHMAWYGSGRTPVYDLTSPMPVVSRVQQSSPAWELANSDLSGTATTLSQWQQSESFHYRGAKIQAGGRGFLGFRVFERFDEEDRILSALRMRQDFPYIGRAHQQESWLVDLAESPWQLTDEILRPEQPCWASSSCLEIIPQADPCVSQNGYGEPCVVSTTPIDPSSPLGPEPTPVQTTSHRLSRVYTEWQQKDSVLTNPDVRFVYASTMLDEQFELDTSIKGRTVRANLYEEPAASFFGQITRSIEFAYNYGDGLDNFVHRQETQYDYFSIPANRWVLNRVHHRYQHSMRPGQLTQTRSTDFAYHPATYLMSSQQQIASNDARQLVTSWLRDNMGNITQTTVTGTDISPARVSVLQYDSLGRWADREYAQLFNPDTASTQLELLSEVTQRDRYGNPQLSYDQQRLSTRAVYDVMGRLYYRWSPTGAWQRETMINGSTASCPAGTAFYQIVDSTAPAGVYVGRAMAPQQVSCYDVTGRVIRTVTDNLNASESVYQDVLFDIGGRVLSQSIPLERIPSPALQKDWLRSSYDELGREVLRRLPDGSLVSTEYTGLETKVIDPRGHQTVTATNILGETVWTEDANLLFTTFTYDVFGNQTQIDGPLPGSIDRVTITYDGFNNRTSLSDPDKGLREYRYNELGEELCSLDQRGFAVSQNYDGLGRLTSRTDLINVGNVQSCSGSLQSVATWRYGHDAGDSANFGQLLLETDEFVERSYFYDSMGRVDSVQHRLIQRGGVIFTQSTSYDEFGRVFQRFDGSPNLGGVQYLYNDRGYQTQIHEASDASRVYQAIHSLDAFGNIEHETQGNGAVTRRLYDERGFLRSIQTGHSDGVWDIQELTMDYDVVGNLMQRDDWLTDHHESMEYDSLNRLMWVDLTLPGQTAPIRTTQMSYDAGGRILSKEGQAYSYDTALPVHAVKSKGAKSYSYDVNGNQVLRAESGNTRELNYTHFDKPWRVNYLGNESRYQYDPLRNKLEREERSDSSIYTRTWYIGGLEILVENPLAPVNQQTYRYRRQIDGIAQVEAEVGVSETIAYYHRDHLNSLTAISFDNSMTVTRLSYDAFGRRRDANDWTFKLPFNLAGPITDHGFGDHETRDELGLIHMGGRTYDPDLGQMMQADAIVQSPLNGQNYNRYSYVFNNPMSYTDPTGFVGEFASSFFNLFSSRSFGFGLPEFLQNDDGQPAAENMLANNMMNGTAKTNPGVAVTSFISNIPLISFDFDGDQLIRTAIDDIEKFNAQVDDFSELGGYPGFFVGRVAQDFITDPVLEALMAAENRDLTGVGFAIVGAVAKPVRAGKKLDDLVDTLNTKADDIIDTSAGFEVGAVTRGLVDTGTIRFTQDTAGKIVNGKASFGDGSPIKGMVDSLKSGTLNPLDVKPIRTFVQDGKIYTLDNRRLLAHHLAGSKVNTRAATESELKKELSSKFTTRNDGIIIGVRGSLEE